MRWLGTGAVAGPDIDASADVEEEEAASEEGEEGEEEDAEE